MTPAPPVSPSLPARIWRSRAFSVLVAGVLAFALMSLARDLLPAIHWGSAKLEPLTEPKRLAEADAAVRDHVREARANLDALQHDRGASPRQRAAAYGELGKVYFVYWFSDPAASCFRNAIALDPDEFRWRYLLAHALAMQTKNADAAAAMASAIDRMKRDVTATSNDSEAALAFLGDMAVRLNKLPEARQTFALILRRDPNHLFSLYKLGQLSSQAGDRAQAIAYFERALALAPQHPEIRQALGAEYRRAGNTAKAAQFPPPESARVRPVGIGYPDPIIAAVQNLARGGPALARPGAHNAAVGRWAEALAIYERAMRNGSPTEDTRMSYAVALGKMGRYREAREQLEGLQHDGVTNATVRSTLDTARVAEPETRRQGLEDALAWRREAPGEPLAAQTLGAIDMFLGRYAEALQVFREAAGRGSDDPWPRLGEAIALSALGRARESRRVLEDALAAFPGDGVLRVNLARLLAASPDAAAREPNRAVEMARELAAAYPTLLRNETLAIALAGAGNFEEAIPLQRRVAATCRGLADPPTERRAEAVLSALEAHKPWREPWPFRGPESSIE